MVRKSTPMNSILKQNMVKLFTEKFYLSVATLQKVH